MIIVLTALLACGDKKPTQPAATPARTTQSQVTLDGVAIDATWDDGDTFRWTDDAGKEHKARLLGFNTLESYGAVHRWGGWTKKELLGIADEATAFARGGSWECATVSGSGGYGRELIDCPQLRRAMLRGGLAHVYAIDRAPEDGDLGVQQQAIQSKAGMWAKTAPEGIVTSLHSNQEDPDKQAYDRVCSTETGACVKVNHEENYRTCEEYGHDGSYMLYIPYANRYGANKAVCLQ